MNFSEIKNAIKHLISTSKCTSCKAKFKENDINIIATTNNEALFEIKCPKCNTATIVTVLLTPNENDIEINEQAQAPEEFLEGNTSQRRVHRKISHNDVLDMKNFLNNFDGNFKKILAKKNE